MIYKSRSAAATKKLAADLAETVLNRGPQKKAMVITLKGELGAGKTTFTQGFFKGLKIKRVPNSPTFILMRRSPLPRRKSKGKKRPQAIFKNVFHVDAYRLRALKDSATLGLKELFQSAENIFLIEWPERISRILPRTRMEVRFTHGKKENERLIVTKSK